MIRIFTVILLTLSTALAAQAQNAQPANNVSIVALIITSGDETPVSISVTHTLESLDAQTLTANAPNASEMRSILKRFAAAALDVDVALVYYDGAVLKIDDREFVAPGGIELRRRSDLLTKAIPLSALARATALAAHGGAVLVHSSGQGVTLIDGVTVVENAPRARTGTSPVLFASSSAALGLADGLEAMTKSSDDISLTETLRVLSELDGVSISQLPTTETMLRVLPVAQDLTTENEDAIETASERETTVESTEDAGSDALGDTSVERAVELPQVGIETSETLSATAETSTEDSLETTSETEDALDETETTDVIEAVEETDAENTDANDSDVTSESTDAEGTDTTTETVLAADSELSMEVLQAMQNSLSQAEKRGLQQHLKNLGFYNGLIDGSFGPQTARAISAYQESIGAAKTGVLTPVQLEALSE